MLNVLGLKGSMPLLVDRVMPWNGDLFTAAMLNSVKVLRSRDRPENRFDFVDPWPGYLHAAFAYLSGITHLHMGDKKAWCKSTVFYHTPAPIIVYYFPYITCLLYLLFLIKHVRTSG